MPSLKIVRKRISSVKSTQKITRAMKLVAAAKLRRAQDDIAAARPYAGALAEVVSEIAARSGPEPHLFFAHREIKRVALVVITSDRGLCGGFNTNACRGAQRFSLELATTGNESAEAVAVELRVVGKKGREYFKRRNFEIAGQFAGATGATAGERAKEIARSVTEDYLAGRIDAVKIVFNEFKSAIAQIAVVEQLLPIEPAVLPSGATQTDLTVEPSLGEVLESLLPMYVESRILRALLESVASEFGARMTAMDNATKNAKDMIERLTLQYNRARQAAITKELMEIVGGAEALKG